MYIFLSLFVISLSSILGMVVFRMWELKTGKVNYKNGSLDYKSQPSVIIEYAGVISLHINKVHKKHVYPVVIHVNKIVVNKIINILKTAQGKLMRVIKSIEGKGELNGNGDVSPFIKSISEHKKRNSDKNNSL